MLKLIFIYCYLASADQSAGATSHEDGQNEEEVLFAAVLNFLTSPEKTKELFSTCYTATVTTEPLISFYADIGDGAGGVPASVVACRPSDESDLKYVQYAYSFFVLVFTYRFLQCAGQIGSKL